MAVTFLWRISRVLGQTRLVPVWVLSATAIVTPAAAGDSRDACFKAEGEAAVAACTAVIASGQLKPRAVENYSKVIELDPKSVGAWNGRCWVRALSGDLEKALEDCNRALQMRPAYARALDSRGLVYLKLGKFADAIKDYSAVLDVEPKNASSLYGRGIAAGKNGDEKAGRADIE